MSPLSLHWLPAAPRAKCEAYDVSNGVESAISALYCNSDQRCIYLETPARFLWYRQASSLTTREVLKLETGDHCAAAYEGVANLIDRRREISKYLDLLQLCCRFISFSTWSSSSTSILTQAWLKF
jgi:hypothetical protein